MRDFRPPGSVGELVRSVRLTGEAPSSWHGADAITMAVVGVFADSVVRGVAEAEVMDNFATAAVTSWIMSEFDEDEYFAGDDINLTMTPTTFEVEWGVSLTSRAVLTARLLEMGDQEGLAPVCSLASFVARQYAEDAAFEAMRTSQHGLEDYRSSPEPHTDDVPASAAPSAVVDWIRRVALRGPQARRPYIYGPLDELAERLLSLPEIATSVFIEFGFSALWRHPEADTLAEVLTDTYPLMRATDCEMPLAPAPARDSFTPEQDAFMRRIVIDRLCKLTVPRTWGGFWSFNNPEILLPFARCVASRASSARTCELAEILTAWTAERVAESESRRRYYREYFAEADNSRAFTLRLVKWVAPLALLYGAVVGTLTIALPDALVPIVGVLALFLLRQEVVTSRRVAKYTRREHSKRRSLVAGLGLAAIYAISLSVAIQAVSGNASIGWYQSISTAFVFCVAGVILTFAVRYPGSGGFRLSSLLPALEGLPEDVNDAARDAIDGSSDGSVAGNKR